MTVVEFNLYDEYLDFQKDLEAQGKWHKLLNEKELAPPDYKDANYIDMR